MHGKKIKILIMLSIFTISSVNMAKPQEFVKALNISENEASKKELKERSEELKEELQKSRKGIREEAKKKENIEKHIEIIKKQIDTSNIYILKLETEIEQAEEKIDSIKEAMSKKTDALKSSLRSIYIAGDPSAIDIILSAKTFEDFLDKAELVRSVSNTIGALVEQLNNDMKIVRQEKELVEENRKSAEKERVELDKNRNDLQELFDESEKILSELQSSEQDVKKELDENNEELKQIEDRIQKYYEQQRINEERERRRKAAEAEKNAHGQGSSASSESPLLVFSGSLAWPVPGYYRISSDYNDTADRRQKHGAIDIAGAGIYGAPIVAAADGKVIMANPSGYGGGYGKHLIIDHGSGLSTLYAHMSGLAVREGQAVKKGQVIGYVGNTGYSTGPHLHFETRSYGKKYDPMTEFRKSN